MGGRRSYPTRQLLGSSKSVEDSFQTLRESMEKHEAKDIALNTLKVFSEAKRTVNYSAYATKLSPYLIDNYEKLIKEKDIDVLRREITKAWIQVKEKQGIETPKEVDKIIIDNAVDSIRSDSND